MDWIYSLPASVKIGSCFAVMLILYRVKLELAWSVLISTLLLTVSTGTGTKGFVYLFHACIAPENILMLLVIMMLSFFSDALSHTGRMEKAIAAFRGIFKSQRVLMAGLPAIIGLLPMPGGALFSAPFLESVDDRQSLSPERKSAINYWFRHLWEYWWPLYPGVILAMQYSGLSFGLFLLIQAPFTLASIAGGWFFLLRPAFASAPESARQSVTFPRALRTLWPIGLLVALSATASLVLPRMGLSSGMANLYGMLGGMTITLLCIFKTDFAQVKKSLRLFGVPATWLLALVIAGVLAFSAVLQMPLDGSKSTLVSLMRDEFLRMGIPLVLVLAIIPFVAGLVTGISVGFVGVSFPIVFALLGSHPPLHAVIAATSLAYVSGYLGIMVSPVHLCYLMSNDYFKARMVPTYRWLLGPLGVVTIAMVLVCAAYFYLLK